MVEVANLENLALVDLDCDEAVSFEGDGEHWVVVVVEMSSDDVNSAWGSGDEVRSAIVCVSEGGDE